MTKIIPNTIFNFLFILFLFGLCGCATYSLNRIPVHSTKYYQVKTKDGRILTLMRIRPRTLKPDPVLLLINSPHLNHFFWNLHPSVDLPKYMARRGWDVWAFTFRSIKESEADKKLYFEDYIFYDLPAVMETVKKMTHTKEIAALGYSFGSTVLTSYLMETKDPFISRAVMVAAPIRYEFPLTDSFYLGLESGVADNVYFNLANIKESVQRDFSETALEPIPEPIIKFYHSLIHTGGLEYDLSSFKIPVLFISGKKDNLASTQNMLFSFHQLGSKDKTFREFGKSNFYKSDYNHYDLILGKDARNEVYPYIAGWLAEHE